MNSPSGTKLYAIPGVAIVEHIALTLWVLGVFLAAASSAATELPPALSMRSLTEAASAAQARSAFEVLGTVEPGDALPVPHGWRSSGVDVTNTRGPSASAFTCIRYNVVPWSCGMLCYWMM